MAMAQLSPFEKHPGKNITAEYHEVIAFYKELSVKYDQVKMLDYGPTDIGKSLNLVVLSRDKIFDPAQIRRQNKRVFFINNGIHPGEPEGIDASMMLARDLLKNKKLPEDVVICIIPVYNIDGMLNRGVSRVNQNGPEAYGFRGNYQNLDLNRDFIKGDSKNSRSFQQIFTEWKPEIFIDNHTSNGADYQYIITLIQTQKDKLNPLLSGYMSSRLVPGIYSKMKAAGFEMTPYVNSIEETPDSGIVGFLETPRYSTGYAALHNAIGFMPETHMLKSFAQRVESTYSFMKSVLEMVEDDAELIGENKRKADEMLKVQTSFPVSWILDKTKVSKMNFKGYQANQSPSKVSGLPRLYYDRKAPFEKQIKIWDHYEPSVVIEKPLAYIIPQSWQKVIDLLVLNKVNMRRLNADTEIDTEMYYIEDYKSPSFPFEGHYLHSQVKLRKVNEKVKFYEGDYIVYTDQALNRYIIETLEPQGTDSFFAWNFFDSVLGQKEHFSDYVFEDEAASLLSKNPALAQRLRLEKSKNAEFAKSASAQLNWIYRNSEYYEKTHMRYPVGRLIIPAKLDLK